MIGEGECKINASFYPEMTEMLKKITNDISEKIIKEGSPIILVDEYSWYREVLSLMAKQINLCDSCLLLLENGMEQEAYLLARSQFNNMLWIKYLCYDDAENTRVKEYFYQPHINQILSCKNIKKMIEDDTYCIDILTQCSAAQSAFSSFSRELLSTHINGCVVRGIKDGDEKVLEELSSVLEKLVK